MRTEVAPVIVIGMHRSGTTMITDMLVKLGLYMGWLRQENSEALFFVLRNERLMNACGGSWQCPEVVESLIDHPEMRKQTVDLLRRDIESWRFLSYLGPQRLAHAGAIAKLDFPWGWKDPRSSFLLPLWLDLFPKARIVHIYRHPMDVAKSLSVREATSIKERLMRQVGRTADESGSQRSSGRPRPGSSRKLSLFRRFSAVQGRVSGRTRYEKVAVIPVLSLQAGLHLWAAYEGECQRHLETIPNPLFSLKYEDFLANPHEKLAALAAFCGLPADSVRLRDLCRKIRSDRRFAFHADPEARRVFDSFRDNRLVRRFGYDREDSLGSKLRMSQQNG